ncbi:MAG: hypothetical protein MZU97_21120 [Bacillus subtilis]|nr:hypothetical protein [Bacillus subtilis]
MEPFEKPDRIRTVGRQHPRRLFVERTALAVDQFATAIHQHVPRKQDQIFHGQPFRQMQME